MSAPFPVTAYSAVNALGTSTAESRSPPARGPLGDRCLCPLPIPFEAPSGALAAPAPPLPAALGSYDSPTARLAAAALDEIRVPLDRALARHGAEHVALVVGTTTAGLARTEEAHAQLTRTGALPPSYDVHDQHSFGGLLEVLRRATGIGGPAFVVSTACSASAKALASAQRLLQAGLADAVLVGGVDALAQTTLRGFHSLEILSRRRCRPFSQRAQRHQPRGGRGLSAARARRRRGPARLLGVGESSDAHHMSAPHPEGAGALAAMARRARARRASRRREVDYVNAHSPGTRLNDLSEALGRSRRCSGATCRSRRRRATRATCWARAAPPRRSSPSSPSSRASSRRAWARIPSTTTLGLTIPTTRARAPCRARAQQLVRLRRQQRQPAVRAARVTLVPAAVLGVGLWRPGAGRQTRRRLAPAASGCAGARACSSAWWPRSPRRPRSRRARRSQPRAAGVGLSVRRARHDDRHAARRSTATAGPRLADALSQQRAQHRGRRTSRSRTATAAPRPRSRRATRPSAMVLVEAFALLDAHGAGRFSPWSPTRPLPVVLGATSARAPSRRRWLLRRRARHRGRGAGRPPLAVLEDLAAPTGRVARHEAAGVQRPVRGRGAACRDDPRRAHRKD